MQEKVKQDLEKKGVLSLIRKMFNDKIHESIKAQQASKLLVPHANPSLESKTGKICLTLVHDFLQSFGLNLSLSIFAPESKQEFINEDIQILEEILGVKSESKNPVLFEVIARLIQEEEDENDSELERMEDETESQTSKDNFYDSIGNSQGYDQSSNSLAMDEFDYIESVRKVKV